MKTFTFNGYSSDELGIVVKSMPSVPRPAKNIESLQVAGRNGSLHIDNGNYNAIQYTIECICVDKSKMDLLSSVLQGTDKLELSTYPGRYWNATIKNQIAFKTYLTSLDSFPLVIELDPIAKSVEENSMNITTGDSFIVNGNVEICPKLTISGTGYVTINNRQVQVLESGITIDCELMQCYKGLIAKNDKVVLDAFPTLHPGTNNVSFTGNITEILIEYREGWI